MLLPAQPPASNRAAGPGRGAAASPPGETRAPAGRGLRTGRAGASAMAAEAASAGPEAGGPARLRCRGFARAEQEAVDLGAQAWRLGGLSCMRQLHDMTIQAVQDKDRRQRTEDGGRSSASPSCVPRLSLLLVGRHRRLAEPVLGLKATEAATRPVAPSPPSRAKKRLPPAGLRLRGREAWKSD